MIDIEIISCPVCESTDFTNISDKGRDYIETKIALCTECGFLYQNPRWTKDQIIEFYKTEYDSYYRSNFTTNQMSLDEYEKYKYGFYPLYQRIKDKVSSKKQLQILDVGTGDGTNLLYLGKKFDSKNLKAIEPSLEGQESLAKKGVTVIDGDVDSNWDDSFAATFDLVTLRHVFEHLHYPNEFLEKIKKCLTPEGILYLAVPDAYNIGSELLEREFFRVVHNYYFTTHSLRNILEKNGFEILEIASGDEFHDSELFVVAKLGDAKLVKKNNGEYYKQIAYLSPFIEKENTWSGRFQARKAFIIRRLYNAKVELKKSLGLVS